MVEWQKRKRVTLDGRKRRKRQVLISRILGGILILTVIGGGGYLLYSAAKNGNNKENGKVAGIKETEEPKNIEQSDAPEETKQPALTEVPEETQKPKETKEPEATKQPKETKEAEKQEESKTAKTTKKPEKQEESDTTEKPKETKKPKQTKEPEKETKTTKEPGTTEKPDNEEEADKKSEEKAIKSSVNTNKKTSTSKTNNSKKKSTNKAEVIAMSDVKWKTVEESYFDDALFIGDSRTQGFALYSGLKNATYYTDKGLMVDTIFTDEVKIDGKKTTIIKALKKKKFKKIYIMLGVNELGWYYENVFIDKYKEIISEIKETQPDAIIYVQSIIHVTKSKSDKDKIYNNKKINERNKLLLKMAEEEGIYYLDINEVVSDENGALFAEATTDGVHLNQKYCKVWKKYLLSHTV